MSASRSVFTKENQARATVISGVAAVVALLGLKPVLFPEKPANPAPAKLRLVAHALRSEATVDATVAGEDGSTAPGRAGAVGIDVTLENRGDYPAFVSEAVVTVRHRQQLANCPELGDPVTVSGKYTVAVPTAARAVPFT